MKCGIEPPNPQAQRGWGAHSQSAKPRVGGVTPPPPKAQIENLTDDVTIGEAGANPRCIRLLSSNASHKTRHPGSRLLSMNPSHHPGIRLLAHASNESTTRNGHQPFKQSPKRSVKPGIVPFSCNDFITHNGHHPRTKAEMVSCFSYKNQFHSQLD